jgi:hypothetical protein
MLSKIAITTSLLVATASATFPPTNLQKCANLAGQAQTDCFQQQFDQQIAADAAAAAADSKREIIKRQSAALATVQQNAGGLQAGLNSGKRSTILWCEGEFIADFVKLVGADRCKQLCSQFADDSVVDTSSSQAAFECLLPLTTKAVDDAKNQNERDAAVKVKNNAALLFIATQFQDKDNSVVVATNNKGHLVTDFSDKTKDIAFNSDERTNQVVLQTKAADADKARATEGAANADPLEKAFATFFIPKLEIQPDVAASRDALRAALPFGDATNDVINSADARFTVIGVNGQPANVVFTDLGQVDQALDAKFASDLASFVTADIAVVNPNGKRALKATEVGSFGQDDDEIQANKLALVTFCQIKKAGCKSSKQGVVSEEQFKEAQVETKAEEAARLEALSRAATTADTAAETKAAANEDDDDDDKDYAAPHDTKHVVDAGNSASSLFVAAGAVMAAVAMFL